MKKFLSNIFKLMRYSGIYYLLIAGLLFVTVDRQGMIEARRLYLAGIAANRGFKDDRDNLLYLEYQAVKKPSDSAAFTMLGMGYFNLGDYAQAEQCFRQALRLDPASKDIQQYLELAIAGMWGKRPEPSRFPIRLVK